MRAIFSILLLAAAPALLISAPIREIPLTSPEGKESTLAELSEQPLTVVVFLGTECPLVKLYAPRLVTLANKFPDVSFVGVNANSQDSLVEIAAYDRRHELTFPMLKDVGNRLADADSVGSSRGAMDFDRNQVGGALAVCWNRLR